MAAGSEVTLWLQHAVLAMASYTSRVVVGRAGSRLRLPLVLPRLPPACDGSGVQPRWW
jgi:hypothetical protein